MPKKSQKVWGKGPISTYAIDKNRANPAYDIFKDKFYFKNGKIYGFKMFP